MAKFNEKTRLMILGAVKSGTALHRAARASGVDRTTLWRWLQRGERDRLAGKRTQYAAFAEAMARAEAEVIGKVERNIVEASLNDWRSGAWYLSKRAPNEYSDTSEAERIELQKRLVAEFVAFIEKHISPGAMAEVFAALKSHGDTQADPEALPAPT